MTINFGVHPSLDMDLDKIKKDIDNIASLGFDGVFVSDSLRSPYDPLMLLSVLSQMSSDLQLGTSVYLLPLRHPMIVAKQVATLQKLSQGRVVFGIGVGWREEEFDILGIDFRRRGMITDESMQVLRQAWQRGSVDFNGRFYKIHVEETGSKLDDLPLIWIGGNSKAAIRRACLFADAWIPTDMSPDEYEQSLPLIGKYLAQANREHSRFRLASHLMLILSEEGDRAERIAGFIASNFSSTLDEIKQWALVGTARDIIDRLALYSKVGVSYHVLSTWAYPRKEEVFEMLKLFSKEVIPSL